jgi:hypothetical protein
MTTLYCILAREADTAVIFRRGPSKLVRLIRWDLATDTFEPGQWLKGRIYHDKSDLSPDGKKLVYLAANWQYREVPSIQSFIAVSSPPYATAHVLWGSLGTWNGISLFEGNGALGLATVPCQSSLEPEEGFTLPVQLEVKSKPWPGYFYKLAEHDRLARDAWAVCSGDPLYHSKTPEQGWPVAYRNSIAGSDASANLEMTITRSAGVAYALRAGGGAPIALKADWADVRGSDVLYAQGGKLFRMSTRHGRPARAVELADFSAMKFEEMEAPDWAKTW